mmetsp:Transcript_96667/g.270585  ORF Transcript_96667/g.270585 Transcript_96667/m.270585 type:complete len:172 (-) Transcript_96667:181-696(-)|eukprot:CAMPEP_0176192662 /NCGR_PEP_ID=MMETSP0121_2-20121125/5087_1 /TAXON_ID=160619 /ORGANISM="Kryptoperidinium foliaceum, Strain CCMP 1326" /LENGTH=171 /DNA_ID=CAMNT_0017531357 /DNA_START=91 /DNA_END=606 /DNA_ORIENTATION=+
MDLFKKQDALKPYFDTAYGCAVFGKVAKAGFGIGGAGGKGDVFILNKGDGETKVGESKMMQLSFGLQFGGQVYSEIIFFESEKDFQNFTHGNFEFSADANVVGLTASASVKASTMGSHGLQAGLSSEAIAVDAAKTCEYSKGMAVFTIALGGLMYQATIGGQKFTYDKIEA